MSRQSSPRDSRSSDESYRDEKGELEKASRADPQEDDLQASDASRGEESRESNSDETLLEEGPRQDLTQLAGLRRPISISAVMLTCIFILASIQFLYFAKTLLLPILFAVVFDFLLSPLVRWLFRFRIPRPVSAVVLIGTLAAVVLLGAYTLSGPAREFAEEAPRQLSNMEYELRGVVEPVEEIRKTAEEVEKVATGPDEEEQSEVVAVRGPGMVETAMGYAQSLGAGALITVILLLFLLSLDDIFLHKLVKVLPTIHDKRLAVEVVRQIEADVSRYLLTVTLINMGLGVATALVLALLGVPNAALWGVMVAAFNYVPYLGPIAAIGVLALVGIVSFDSIGQALLPPLAFFGLNLIEAYVVTPITLGRRLDLNPVMIFLSLAFFGFIWSVPGMLLAVPLLVTVKIVCEHIEPLASVSTFLSGAEE